MIKFTRDLTHTTGGYWLLAAFGILFSSGAVAQTGERPHDPMASHLFPPELVMRHQRDIGLAEEQREAIRATIQEAQSTFSGLQWDLESEMATLVDLIAESEPDEESILTQLERVLATENDMKRAQLSLMIRIKSQLSSEQQSRLKALRGE